MLVKQSILKHEWLIIDLVLIIRKDLVTDKHFIEEENHSLDDFDVQIIVQLENVPNDKDQARKHRKQFEGYWQITLCMLAPYGLNSINKLEANLK